MRLLQPSLLCHILGPVWKLILRTGSASKHLRKPLWAFSWLSRASHLNLSRATSRGSAWSTRAALAKLLQPLEGGLCLAGGGQQGTGAWDCFFANSFLGRKRKRNSGDRRAACRETAADGAKSPSLHPSLQGSWWPVTSPPPSPSPRPPCCPWQGLCHAGGSAAPLVETWWRHLRGPVVGEERCLRGRSPSLGQLR